MGNANNIKITPMNVTWYQTHKTQFDFQGLTGTAVAGKYVTIYPANSSQGYYAFFDTGSSTDPAPAGLTKISVSVATSDQAAQLATKFAAALAAVSGTLFIGTASGTAAVINRNAPGDTQVASAGQNTAGVKISILRRGRNVDLGFLEGDIGLSFDPSNYEIKAHQTGTTPLAALYQGLSKLEAKTTLQETSASQLQLIYNVYGGTFTSTGGNSIYGVGSVAQGKNLLTEAGRLQFKPVNATDNSENVTMMLAIPVPGSLTFSGENPRKLEITWNGFVDPDFNTNANAIAIGDLTGL